MLGDAAGGAVTFAEEIAEAGNAYLNFLKDMGALPADQLDTEKQLQERIRKLSGMAHGGGLLNDVRRAVFGDAINEELREAVAESNRRIAEQVNEFARTRGLPDDFGLNAAPGVGRKSPQAPAGVSGTKGGKIGKGRDLPDFAKDAQEELAKLLEAEARAREQFDAIAASLAGPVAEANYRYKQDLAEINELAKVGAVDSESLRAAQERLAAAHEANLRMLEAQLTPAEEAIRQLQEETVWLAADEEGQRRLAAARMLGANATQEQIDKAVDLMRVNDQMTEANHEWEDLNRSIADSLFGIVSGAESAEDAVKGFLDSLNRQILSNFTDDWADGITDWLKGLGKGSGASATGGGFWASLLSAFGFADGGFTGTGGKNEPAGIVHRGEYVLSADATRRIGVPFLEALNSMKGYAVGGLVGAINENGDESLKATRRFSI